MDNLDRFDVYRGPYVDLSALNGDFYFADYYNSVSASFRIKQLCDLTVSPMDGLVRMTECETDLPIQTPLDDTKTSPQSALPSERPSANLLLARA